MNFVAHAISARPSLDVVRAMLDEAGLPASDITDAHCDHFFYAGSATRPDGIVGIELLGEAGLLRSLAVRGDARGSGLGSGLVRGVEDYARSRGVRAIYLLTTTAEKFFEARGYGIVARDAAPAAIRSTREFAGICPASSAFMLKRIG